MPARSLATLLDCQRVYVADHSHAANRHSWSFLLLHVKVADSLDTRLNRDNYGVVVATYPAGMVFLPHYGYPGHYEHDDPGVSSTCFHKGTPRHHHMTFSSP